MARVLKIKKLDNQNVEITNTATDEVRFWDPQASLNYTNGRKAVGVFYSGKVALDLFPESVASLQIGSDPEEVFNGDVNALMLALGVGFFFPKPNGGGGGIDTNFLKDDLVNLTAPRTHSTNQNWLLENIQEVFGDDAEIYINSKRSILNDAGGNAADALRAFFEAINNVDNSEAYGGVEASNDDPAAFFAFARQFIGNERRLSRIYIDNAFGVNLQAEKALNGVLQNRASLKLRGETGVFGIEGDGLTIDIPSADTVGKVLKLTNATTKTFEAVESTSIEAANVADEDARDSTYPTPTNGQRVFNIRTQEIETYSSTFGLWLSPTKKVAIRQTALSVNRFAYINSFFTVGGFSYPVLAYPTDATNENSTFGVILEIGATIDVARSFVSIAVGNQHYIEYGEAIAIGEFVSAKVNGANSDQGLAAGNATTSGRAGIAIQNSGATIGKATMVLAQLNLLAETF